MKKTLLTSVIMALVAFSGAASANGRVIMSKIGHTPHITKHSEKTKLAAGIGGFGSDSVVAVANASKFMITASACGQTVNLYKDDQATFICANRWYETPQPVDVNIDFHSRRQENFFGTLSDNALLTAFVDGYYADHSPHFILKPSTVE